VQQAAGSISVAIDPPGVRPQETGQATQPQIDSIVKLELDGSAMDLEPL
jgi:hypothetical protein